MGFTGVSSQEEIIHELAELLEICDDTELIEKAFLESVRQLTSARSVMWARVSTRSPGGADQYGHLEILVQAGSLASGRLLLLPPSDSPTSWSPETLKRLKTLCTMTASALLRNHGQTGEGPQPAGEKLQSNSQALAMDLKETNQELGNLMVKENNFAVACHDATFLHAVLPYALGLSRRHGEPLSLLCVAIDRVGGILELLGRDSADRAVRNVGAHIASMIRESDIVARLDDDRIIAVLPRARLDDACNLARKVCTSIESTRGLLPELPVLTTSIGVAEFPACADNVYGLLDAADVALSMARSQGRNQAVAAATLSSVETADLSRCAS